MDENILGPIILIIFFIGFLIVNNYIQERNRKIRLWNEIDENFGENYIEKYNFSKDELYKVLGGNVDDLLYSDLLLDTFLENYNHTKSTPGMHYFYYSLRNLKKDINVLEKIKDKRKRLIENIEATKDIQFEIAKLGVFKDSILELLFEDIEIDNSMKKLTYIFSFTLVYIIVGFLLFREYFIIFIFVLLAGNYYIYKQFNKMTYGKLNGILNLQKLLILSKNLEEYNDSAFSEEIHQLEILNKDVKSLYKMLNGVNISTGNIEIDFAETYKNILFLSEGRRFIKASKYLKLYNKEILEIYKIIGLIDSEIAIASITIANDLKDANFIDSGVNGKALRNPYIENSIENDLEIYNNSILLTGSNASGKSTYLRTVGINLVLAQSFGVVFAERFNTELIDVRSAISISDSILENRSYFMTEAQVIKSILESDRKQFVLLDEIFRGTNTIDRVSVATSTLKYMVKNNIVIAATHDIELTENLKNDYLNFHFEEEIIDDDLVFDYKIKNGPVSSRNATMILKTLDYPKEIIKEAEEIASILEK